MQLGHSVALANDGTWALIQGEGGVAVADLAHQRRLAFHALEDAADMAAVGSELWVASSGGRLLQFAADRTLRGERELWGGRGLLRPCALGEPGALWSEPPAGVVLASGVQSAIAMPGEVDCAIPITHTRWLVCQRDRVQLRDPGTERWSVSLALGSARIVDGAALLGGRTAALLVAREQQLSHLIVLALHDGSVQHRIALQGVERVRFAAARGLALVHLPPDTIVLMDLRFGNILKEHRAEAPVVDTAIDGIGQTFLLRSDQRDDFVFGSVDALLETPSQTTAVFAGEPAAEETGPQASAEAATAPDTTPFYRGHRPLPEPAWLAPRPRIPLPPVAASAALLERYRELISAMTGRAIARAWNDGRLSAAVEGGLPYHDEVYGLRGRAGSKAPEDLVEADRDLDRAWNATRAAEEMFTTSPSPLVALARELDLSNVGKLVLLVVAAPPLWGELARLYGILANDPGRPLVDEFLVSQILESHASRSEVARELDEDAPLVRHGVIRVAPGKLRPFLPLTCEPVVLRRLRGDDQALTSSRITIVRATRTFEQLLVPAVVKHELARRIADAPASRSGRFVVRGRTSSGRHTLLATIGRAANRDLACIDVVPMLRDLRHQPDMLVAALCGANLAGLLPCVDGLEHIPSDDPGARDAVRRILDHHPGPLAIRLPPDAEPPLSPGYLAVDLPALGMEQRTTSWRVLLDEHGLVVRDIADLADRFRVGPGVMARACAALSARRQAAGDEFAVDASHALETAIRQHLDVQLRASATRVERLATWSRVILPPDIQQSVLELIARIKHRHTVYDTWGLGDVLTTSRGVTALFQGGPGTGKTLVASAIANELGMDLYRVDLSRIMSKWIGETEQNLAKLFDAAEDGHTIVLFDEADSLFAKRTEVRTSVDRYANLEVNYLLQRLDSFEGIAILTTNFGTAIDNAFKRRLSFRLTFPFPDEDAREALWRAHLPGTLPKSRGLDLAALARKYQLSGGYIRNAALRAAFLAAEEQTAITQGHLERAIKAEFREIGKITEAGVLE